MMAQAVETHIVARFSLVGSLVPDRGTVGYTVTAVLRRFLDALPAEEAAVLLDI